MTPTSPKTEKPAPLANRNAPKWASPNHIPEATSATGRFPQKPTADATASNALRLSPANVADVESSQFNADHAAPVMKSSASQSRAASLAVACVDAHIELASKNEPILAVTAANITAALRKLMATSDRTVLRDHGTAAPSSSSSVRDRIVTARPTDAKTIQATTSARAI